MIPSTNEESEVYEENAGNDLERVFEMLDEKCEFLVHRLRDFVKFPTVSSDPSKIDDIFAMGEYLVEILKRFEMKPTAVEMILDGEGSQTDTRVFPPLILAETAMDSTKRTVCIYTHFDVCPVTITDYWYNNPFLLTPNSDNSELFGKGTSVAKGPLLSVLNAIGAFRQLRIPLPVNVKLVLDPMGVADDEITGKFLRKNHLDFFQNVDFVCMCVGHWFGNVKPCVIHGSRGLCYFHIEIEGASKDLHGGNYGGLLNEPMSDLVNIMDQLVDKRGRMKMSDIYKDVAPLTKEEKDCCKATVFNVREFKQEIGARELLHHEDKVSLLLHRWRMPSLSIHGIEGAFSESGTRNVIPRRVIGKFSINLVPHMTPSKVKKVMFDYLGKIWKSRKSLNKIRVQMTIAKLAWYTDPNDVSCTAAKNAIRRVYDEDPELIRGPNRIRMANVLRKVTNASVIVIPVGKPNDISDSRAEKIDTLNYINGSKVYAAYFQELSKLAPMERRPEPIKECACMKPGVPVECTCDWNEGSFIEEEHHGESMTKPSLDDTGFSLSEERFDDEPSSTRYFHQSLIVRKKICELRDLIEAGDELIGPHIGITKEAEEEASAGETDFEPTNAFPSSKIQVAPISEVKLDRNSATMSVKSVLSATDKTSNIDNEPSAITDQIRQPSLQKRTQIQGPSLQSIVIKPEPSEGKLLKEEIVSSMNPRGSVQKLKKTATQEEIPNIPSLSLALSERRLKKANNEEDLSTVSSKHSRKKKFDPLDVVGLFVASAEDVKMGYSIVLAASVSGFWAVVGFILPFFVPKGENKGTIQWAMILTSVCCWMFWALTYVTQMNPLQGPKLTQLYVWSIAKQWGNPVERG